jgi:hypothetical protein
MPVPARPMSTAGPPAVGSRVAGLRVAGPWLTGQWMEYIRPARRCEDVPAGAREFEREE